MRKFTTITDIEFNEFSRKYHNTSFYQSSYWGELKAQTGWKSHFVGVYENDSLIAAAMLLEKKLIASFKLFYSPRGFLINYNDKELLSFFTTEIKRYAKKHHVIFTKIDPYVMYQERDINADIVENGQDNFQSFTNIIAEGYQHKGFETEMNLQPRWISVLDLKKKDRSTLQKEMSQTTRNLIRRNEKIGVVSRVANSEDMEVFKDIMTHTSKRKGFLDRPLSYYMNMHKFLSKGEMIQLYITELKPDIAIENYSSEKKQVLKRIDDRQRKIDNNEKVNVAKLEKKNVIDNQEIDRLDKKITEFEELKKSEGRTIVLGAAIYILYGNEVLSLFAGSYDHLMRYSSSYSTYWHMIEYALDSGYEYLNFYGISGNFEESNPRIGLFHFKRDFGCKVVELLGEFDLITNPFMYQVYRIAMAARRQVKKLKKRNQ